MVPGRSLLLLAVLGLGLSAQGAVETRIAEFEFILNQHFRGARLEEARERSNRDIEAFNARTKALNGELAELRGRLDKAQGAALEAHGELQRLDAALRGSIPDGNDKAGNAKYQSRIAERNTLAEKVKGLNAELERQLGDHNAFATKMKMELERQRAQVLAEQEALNRRLEVQEKFVKSGQDLAFFGRVNGLLAEIRGQLRMGETPHLHAALAKVRGIRRELGAWAMTGQALNPKGLVVVEAQVRDEPCWLIVDSGATDTVLSPELAEAIGLGAAQSDPVSLVVVGGLRLQGRQFRIPRLSAAGQTLTDVSATAVRPADVGIDGLLGQSFLKAFVYTVDERTPAKLVLIRK